MTNAARPAPGTPIASVAKIPDGGALPLHYRADGAFFSIILARRGEAVFAYENKCPHAGNRLDEMYGGVIVQKKQFMLCPHHGASFELHTGACVAGPAKEGLARVEVRVEGGVVVMG